MKARQVVFYTHLVIGLLVGLGILVMALTGMMLAFRNEMIAKADHATFSVPTTASADSTLNYNTLVETHRPASLTIYRDPTDPIKLGFGKGKPKLYVNPQTGESLGEGNLETQNFFRWVEDMHRWLTLEGAGRDLARVYTGSVALLFFVLVVSGLVLWFPRNWKLKSFTQSLKPQWKKQAKARYWNWHNVFGFWFCLPLFLISLTGIIISFSWANNLLFQITGNEPPPAKQAASSPAKPGNVKIQEPPPLPPLEPILQHAQSEHDGWRSVSLQLPSKKNTPINAIVDLGHGGRPDLKYTLKYDTANGAFVSRESFADYNLGKRLRTWVRFIHTGEVGGIAGEALALLSSLAALLLIYTGFYLSWKRLQNFRKKAQLSHKIKK
ncbi:MAG: PepSY-associated TM helix domain-containing protein [Chthoniobacterales bacterium]